MKIKIDRGKERIIVDSNEIYYFQNYAHNVSLYLEEYSKVLFKLKKYLVIDDFNYAHILGYLVYQHDYYFPNAPGLIPIFNYLDLLDSIEVKKEKKKELNIEINDFYYETFKKCANLVSKKKGFKINILKEEYTKRRFSFLYDKAFFVRNLLKTRLWLRYLIGMARKIMGKKNHDKADVLFVSNLIFANPEPEKNLMFGPVIKELNKNRVSNKVLIYETLYQTEKIKKFLKEYLLNNQAYIGDHYTLKHFAKCKRDFKQLRKKWEEERNNEEFKKIFVYKGYNFYNIIKPRLDLVFNALSYIACDNRFITQAIINSESFMVACLDHEENMYGKGLMLNLRANKAKKIIALAHEIISDYTVHIHFKNKEVLNRDSILWRPLPDVKCVWGEYAKKKLIEKCNYPAHIIRVTGNPKFDFLFEAGYNPEGILKRLGLDNKRKKILLGEQGSPDLLRFIKAVANQNPEFDFLLKPHPMEDVGYWKQALKNKPSNICVIDKFENIYNLISISEYVLTMTSTVGFESMLAGKIVMVIKPAKGHWIGLPYVKGGAAVELRTVEEVGKELKKLQNKEYAENYRKRIKAFVDYIHYKNDGKAAERVVKEIMEYL